MLTQERLSELFSLFEQTPPVERVELSRSEVLDLLSVYAKPPREYPSIAGIPEFVKNALAFHVDSLIALASVVFRGQVGAFLLGLSVGAFEEEKAKVEDVREVFEATLAKHLSAQREKRSVLD